MSCIPIPWFNEAQYEQLREAQIDRDRLPSTWPAWFWNLDRQLASRGVAASQVIRIELNLADLSRYCLEHGLQMVQQGRVAYANATVRIRLKLERWWTIETATPSGQKV